MSEKKTHEIDDRKSVADYMPQSPDLRAERLASLRKLFPDIFDGEGHLVEKELRALIDPTYHPVGERYEFPWTGKTKSKREAFTPSRAALVYDAKRSVNPGKAGGNVIIEGENLETLKLLTAGYRERVKLIYIDPPYNTGKDFVYSDDYSEGRKPYWEESGVTERGVNVDTNSESDGRYHSNWLSMMHARLLIARYLLRMDGVIFVSIDDNEVHNLRRLMDEVFGQENFGGHIHWRRRHNQPNDPTKMLGLVAEHILVYARDEEAYKASGVGKVPLSGKFSNPDKDPRGDWASKPWKVGSDQSGTRYIIVSPTGLEIDEEWMGEEETFQRLLDDGRIVFPDGGKGMPRKKYFKSEREAEGQCASNWWTHKIFGDNQSANDEVEALLGERNIFSNPKPLALLAGVLAVANVNTTPNDIVLDFFGGSGTTGQAVMDLNAADGGKRQFILVQLPELTGEGSAAYKAEYKKISDITIERNKRVIERYQKQAAELLPNDPKRQFADSLGFKVYSLEKSSFPRVDFAPDPDKTEDENIELLKQYIKDKEASFLRTWDRDRIRDEVLLKCGFILDYTLEKSDEFKKNDVQIVRGSHKTALLCLDESIEPETVDAFKKNADRTFICLEAALDSTKKWNLKHRLGERLRAI